MRHAHNYFSDKLLGVLLLAKDAGQLASLKPVLDKLRDRSLHVSEALYVAILASAGEAA